MAIEGLPNAAVVVPSSTVTGADPATVGSGESAKAAVVSSESNNGVHSTGNISASTTTGNPDQIERPGLQNPKIANGPANDAYQLLAALTGSNSAEPSQLLDALANQAGNAPKAFNDAYRGKLDLALNRQIASLSQNELKQAVARLDSPATRALLATLHEGAGVTGLKNRNLTEQVLRQMANQLHQLQSRLGVSKADAQPAAAELAEARVKIDEFISKFDQSLDIQKGTLNQEQAYDISANRQICDKQALNNLAASESHPHVCEQFCKDVVRDHYIIEHADGRREFLIPPDSRSEGSERAADRLLEFCGNDSDKALLISRLANQATIAGAECLSLGMAGKLDLPGAESGLPHALQSGYSDTTYLIKQNSDGSYSVSADQFSQLALAKDTLSDASTPLNANVSQFATSTTINVSADNSASFGSLDYELTLAPLPAAEADRDDIDFFSNRQQTALRNDAVAERYGVDPLNEFSTLGADIGQARELANNQDASALRNAIESSGIDDAAKQILLSRLEFAAEARIEIDALIASGTAEGADQAILRAGDLNSDLRLLQQDLSVKLQAWSDNGNNQQLATLTAATFAALGGATAELEGVAADLAAALDDARGDLNQVAANSLLARSENAIQHAEASIVALFRIIAEVHTDGASEAPEQLTELLAEAQQRLAQAKANHEEVQSGGATNRAAGAGTTDSNERQQLQRQLAASLARGEKLPEIHPQLTEANIFQARVDHLRNSNPELTGALEKFERYFAQSAEEAGNNHSWQKLNKTVNDIDDLGNLHQLTSTIVPAKQFEAGFADYGGYGNGVGAHSRTSGLHLSNLASTKLANSAGKTVFSGLRHGIIDAYTITPKKLAKLTDDRLAQLHANTLAGDAQWNQWAAAHGGGSTKADIELIRGNSDAAKLATDRAREIANLNAAKELVRAAIVDNQFLYQSATSGQPVDVTLDSVSLVTPDYARSLLGMSGSEREMQAGQRAALAELTRQPFDLQLRDKNGNPHTVTVKLDARDFNFGVNSYSLTKGSKVPFFKKLMGWDAADKRNSELLTKMIGPINDPALGGEVGQVLKFLEEGVAPDNMSPQVLNALAGGADDAFADSGTRARAIRLLAGHIKELYRSGEHRIAGIEPYKLV
ncbi:MAG: hypothetical protein OXC81_06410, partial [Betaproteobacteria bacterium]|nr:hypothetical protein [Betaproteobacteria bacterium]